MSPSSRVRVARVVLGGASGAAALAVAVAAVVHVQSRAPAPTRAPAPPAPPSAPAAHLGAVTHAAPPLAPAAAAASAPAEPAIPARGPHAYVGAETCRGCHKPQFSRWQKDWHVRALSHVTPGSRAVVGRFDGAHFKGSSSEAWMHRGGDSGFAMRTRSADGTIGDFAVSWVIGGRRMQDTVDVFPDGRWQVLPVYYHVTGGGAWVDYTESKQGPVDPAHPFFWTNFRRNVQHECLDCHTTGLRISFDRHARRFTTEFADAGVACEGCHGPGARHAETMAREDIVQPARLDPERGLSLCAQCHGPRNPLYPLFDAEHHFQAGDRYGDWMQPLLVVSGAGRSGDFFADGRPKTSSFEYQALLQSRCHRIGGATCLTCHTAPHDEHATSELKRPKSARATAVADASCAGCHADITRAPAAHSHHASGAAQRCVACHMPGVLTGVLDTFADHALDVPVPQNTARHHVPSACGVCHKDKTPEQLDAALRERWPDAAGRQARRLRLADAIDEATAPASRPALLAVLADPHEAPSLRGTCAVLLAQRFPHGAAGAIRPLLRDADALVRTRAVEALGFAQAREAAGEIAQLLDDGSLFVRQAAALTLVTLGDTRGEGAVRALAGGRDTGALMQPHYVLAQLAARRGDLAGATTELERAVDRMPYFVDGLVGLAEAYWRLGRVELARERLTEALYFDPHHAVAQQKLQRLGGASPGQGPGPGTQAHPHTEQTP